MTASVATAQASVLWCTVCGGHFSLAQAQEGKFALSTGVCVDCYERAVALPPKMWCFGKETVWSATSRVCGEICPDREVCKVVVRVKKKCRR